MSGSRRSQATGDRRAGPQADPDLRSLFFDSRSNLVRELITAVLALLTSVVAARGLGTEGYGVYGFAVLIPSTAFALLSLGLAPGLVYVAGTGGATIRTLFRSALRLSLPLGLLATIVFGLAGMLWSRQLFPGVNSGLLMVALGATPIYFLFNALVAVVQGVQDFRSYNLLRILVSGALLLSLAAAVHLMAGGALGAMTAWASAYLLGILALPLLRITPSEAAVPAVNTAGRVSSLALAYGLRAHLGNLMTFLSYRLDRYLIASLAGPIALGLYMVASGLAERLWVLSTSAGAVLFPRIASLHGDEASRERLTSTVARHIFLMTFILGLGLALAGEWVVRFFYGDEYRQASIALALLIPGVVALSLSRILANDLAGRGRPELNSYIAVFGLVANVLANIILIPRYGIAGAALASSLSYSASAIVKVVVFSRLTNASVRSLVLVTGDDLRKLWKLAARWLRG